MNNETNYYDLLYKTLTDTSTSINNFVSWFIIVDSAEHERKKENTEENDK